MIRLENVTKQFDGVRVVDNLSVEIRSGETVVLIGPSGCGKSTILRMIAGLVCPTSGHLYFNDRPIDLTTLASLRLQLGYVIQEGGLFPHLTVADNVTLVARFQKRSRQDINERVAYLSKLVNLTTDILKRYPRQISGGQRQRVALMRALMLDPPALLLDEPLAALDPLIRRELQDELKSIFAELNKAVLFVTHDVYEADHFSEDVILLNRGRIAARGAIAEFANLADDSFASQFVRSQRRRLRGEDAA